MAGSLGQSLGYWLQGLVPHSASNKIISGCAARGAGAQKYLATGRVAMGPLLDTVSGHGLAIAGVSHNRELPIKAIGKPRLPVHYSSRRFLSGIQMSGEEARNEETSLTPIDSDTAAGATSKNKAKNDAKRAAKMEKFLAKQSKVEQFKKDPTSAAATPKPKTFDAGKDNADAAIAATPAGEKKDMSRPMANAYDPLQVEAGWYAWWERSGFFKPECHGPVDEKRERFTIVMPPPNVTGSLHLGHATMLSIEDALVRW